MNNTIKIIYIKLFSSTIDLISNVMIINMHNSIKKVYNYIFNKIIVLTCSKYVLDMDVLETLISNFSAFVFASSHFSKYVVITICVVTLLPNVLFCWGNPWYLDPCPSWLTCPAYAIAQVITH